ncbi:MAG: hypothetical protein ACYCYI_14180 [Saccharofermentanales bacterium]
MMKKIRLLYFVLILLLSMIFILISTSGCAYFWPYGNENKIVLPPKIADSPFSYITQSVVKGTVRKFRVVSSTFTSFNNSTNPATKLDGLYFICFVVTSDQPYLYKQNEKGTIILDNTIPKTPQFGKNIIYDAKVFDVSYNDALTVYTIKIIGDYDKNYIKEGTLASFQILDEEKDDVIMIPRSAVKSYLSRNYVGLLKNGAREDTMITIGLYGTDSVEVLDGLSVGDIVIMN